MDDAQKRVETALVNELLATTSPSQQLTDAMGYSVLGGGKRIRAALIYATAKALSCDLSAVDPAAAAVEMIHAYSLIHDDLPAMDDDDLRRGKPSCHIAYGEAAAILAGDALQSLAFELLTRPHPTLTSDQRCNMAAELARAIGVQGMAAGQAIDIAASNSGLDITTLEQMHRLKTGALIQACCQLTAIVGNADKQVKAALKSYSENLGLCFQICDDILDVTASTDELGKPNGSDTARQMPTYVTLLGLEGARQEAERCSTKALEALTRFGPEANLLRELVKYQLERTH